MIISDRYVPMKLFTQGSIADHQLNGRAFEQTPGDSGGWGSLACCSSWGCRVGHDLATEQRQEQPTKMGAMSPLHRLETEAK